MSPAGLASISLANGGSTGRGGLPTTALYGTALFLILAVVFILPSGLKSMATVAFAWAIFILLCLQRPNAFLFARFPMPVLVCFWGMALLALVAFAVSPYSKTGLLIGLAFLLLSFVLFGDEQAFSAVPGAVERMFYAVCVAVVCYELATWSSEADATHLNANYDKNYFAIIVFLLFEWCWVTKRKAGVAVCVAAAIVVGSRNYVIMLALFFGLELVCRARRGGLAVRPCRRPFVARRADCIKAHADSLGDSEELGVGKIAAIFLAMLLGIGLFSCWWSESVVGPGTTAYKASLNDSSNAIRFNSDYYAILHLADNPELILYGYDSDIIDAMGIANTNEASGGVDIYDGIFFNGYRVVQPHHCILNMMLRYGVAFTVLYYAVLCFVFSRYFRWDNLALWVPYLFGCMFMHSLLSDYYLFFFLLVLARSRGLEAEA